MFTFRFAVISFLLVFLALCMGVISLVLYLGKHESMTCICECMHVCMLCMYVCMTCMYDMYIYIYIYIWYVCVYVLCMHV